MGFRTYMATTLLATTCLGGCASLTVQAPSGVDIPDGASTVVVSGVVLDDARTSLIQQGFTVAAFDRDGGILRTEPWAEEDGMNPLRITINAMPDSSLVLRGQWAYGRYSRVVNEALAGTSADQLEGWNAAAWNDNSNARQAFLDMWQAAGEIGGEAEIRR